MNTDTPRTDKFTSTWDFHDEPFEAAEHARTLERELTAARAEATHYEAVAQKAMDNLIAVREELAIFKANNPKAHAANFNRGNAIKYIWKAGEKNSEIQDLKKAAWYINREIERMETTNPNEL